MKTEPTHPPVDGHLSARALILAGADKRDGHVLADTFDGDDGDTLRGDESGSLVFNEGVVNVVVGASK